jgi:cysteinyl-tRNA synthetase
MSVAAESKSKPTSTKPKNNIRIYNTLTRSKEPFETLRPGKVGMYLCGPTVYKESHIGHMVGPVIFDTIKRYLVYNGYQVDLVVNITDVDDKLIAESNRREIPMSQVATEMTADYCANLLELGVNQITHMPRATDHMDEIISFISELETAGFAYAVDSDVFFDVSKDAEYGKLTNRRPEDQQGDGGGAASRKRNPGDFALWKSAKTGEPSWESPWGNGRPGWHIECSAMSRSILGKTFDIHGGGLDLTFPHHENEIAQSECCHQAPMARYWMHNGLMRASSASGKLGGKSEREKMEKAEVEEATIDTKISRSKGGGGLRGLISEQTGERLRFFLLRAHYRSTNVFGPEPLEEAGAGLEKFYVFFERYQRIAGLPFYLGSDENETRKLLRTRDAGDLSQEKHSLLKEVHSIRESYLAKMDDDFNTGGAVSELFSLLSLLNKFAHDAKLEEAKSKAEDKTAFLRATETLRELAGILGLFFKPARKTNESGNPDVVDGLMRLMIQLRADARASKDFATSDRIRDGLAALNISLEDRKGETGWKMG